MTRSERKIMDIRYAAVIESLIPGTTKLSVCETYNISRPTLDAWISKYNSGNIAGLADKSSRPHSCPNATPVSTATLILAINKKKGWKGSKIHKHMGIRYPEIECPSESTINNILSRHGRCSKYKTRRKFPHPGKPVFVPSRANHFWTIDFKGQFRTLDGIYCYPLTIRDAFTGMLLCVKPITSTSYKETRAIMEGVFHEFGLPEYIVSDNGVPFVTNGFHGLSQLNIWWTELGIGHIRTEPASPQQNASHERMHREMKRHCTRPPEINIKQQAKRLEEFRHDYNEELSIGNKSQPPIYYYTASKRQFQSLAKAPVYPDYFEKRLVSANGGFRWNHAWIPLTHAMEKKYIGLEEIDDGKWKVWYYDRFLGFFDEKIGRIEDIPERYVRW